MCLTQGTIPLNLAVAWPGNSRQQIRPLPWAFQDWFHAADDSQPVFALLALLPYGVLMCSPGCRPQGVRLCSYSAAVNGLCPTACAIVMFPFGSFPSNWEL